MWKSAACLVGALFFIISLVGVGAVFGSRWVILTSVLTVIAFFQFLNFFLLFLFFGSSLFNIFYFRKFFTVKYEISDIECGSNSLWFVNNSECKTLFSMLSLTLYLRIDFYWDILSNVFYLKTDLKLTEVNRQIQYLLLDKINISQPDLM